MKNSIKYGFYLLLHPIDGFWNLKHEKQGTVRAALLFVTAWFATNVLSYVATEFQFNDNYSIPLDIFKEFRSVFLLFLLFCVGNWSVTTLMDGKGTFKDIVQIFGYACLPMTLLGLVNIICSHLFNASGEVYYQVIAAAAWIWFAVLMFIGVMNIHEYDMAKTVGTLLLTAVAIVVILFIVMVFYNILSYLFAFALTIYKEISVRI